MIRNSLLLLPLLALPVLLSNSTVPDPAPRTIVSQPADSALQEAMTVLKGGQRAVKKLIADPAGNEAKLLSTLAGMESAIMVSLVEKAPAPEGLTGKPLALFHVGYRRKLVSLLGNVLELREAALNQDASALKTAYGNLSGDKKTGHGQFRDF